MATAADLMRNARAQSSPEEYIIIGSDKFITVPDSLKRIAVQFEHCAETVTFKCPRYWDEDRVDLNTLVLCINYTLPDGTPDCYPQVSKHDVDDNFIHFDWTISENLTKQNGMIQFSVCGVSTTTTEDGEEKLVVRWSTEINRDMYVSEGMECPASEIIEEYQPDLVIQLLQNYMSVEEIRQTKNEAVAAKDTAVQSAKSASDTLASIQNEADYIKNSYAPAIKGDVSGEIIRVDDVSPIEHDVKCRVRGKNLLNDVKFKIESGSINGVTCTANADGSYTISGANTTSSFVTFSSNRTENYEEEPLIPAGTYTPTPGVTVVCRDEVTRKETNNQQTFTASNPFRIMCWYCYVGPNSGAMGGSYAKLPATVFPQLEEGSIATSYEQYIDPTNVTIMARGKNVLELSDNVTHNGVTKTVHANGLITVKGTSTSSININVGFGFMKAGYKYRPLIQKITSDVAPSFWNFEKQANINKDKDGYISSDVDTEFSAFVYTAAAGTVYDAAFRVMVELVTDGMTDDYEPYKGSEVAVPSSSGTCTITSKSPTMTLFTDTPGVTIEAEYNRDTTKMFESYVLTDNAKNEIAGLVANDMAEVLESLNDYATSLIGGGD